jgi:hypothetical protein
MIGAGGVGDAAAKIAGERRLLRAPRRRRLRPRARRGAPWRPSGAAGRGRSGSTPRRSTRPMPRRSPALIRRWVPRTSSTPSTLASSCRSSRLPRAAGANYLDMAMSLSQRHPRSPTATGVKLGDEQFARPTSGRPTGGWRCRHRRRARPVGRLRSVCRRPPLLAHRRVGHPRRRQPRTPRPDGNRDLRPRLLDVDDHRGVPQPAGGLEKHEPRPAVASEPASSPCRRSASPRSSTSPKGSDRWSACTSSTRRCSSCRAGSMRSGSPSSTAWASR